MKLVEELKQYCLDRRMTQQELAKKLGVTFVAVNRWFNAKAKPRDLHEHQIKKLLETNISLIGYQHNESARGLIEEEGSSSHGCEDNFIEDIKFTKDARTREEKVSICYISDRFNARKRHTINITGKELVELIEKNINTGKMTGNVFINNKGEKYTWGIGTPKEVESLNIEKDFKTTLEVLDGIRRNLNINNRMDRGMYGIRKAGI